MHEIRYACRVYYVISFYHTLFVYIELWTKHGYIGFHFLSPHRIGYLLTIGLYRVVHVFKERQVRACPYYEMAQKRHRDVAKDDN